MPKNLCLFYKSGAGNVIEKLFLSFHTKLFVYVKHAPMTFAHVCHARERGVLSFWHAFLTFVFLNNNFCYICLSLARDGSAVGTRDISRNVGMHISQIIKLSGQIFLCPCHEDILLACEILCLSPQYICRRR